MEEKQNPVEEYPTENSMVDSSGVHVSAEISDTTSSQTCDCNENSNQEKESYIYAVGRIEARFPSLGVEKEFVQALKENQTAHLTDQQVLYEILKQEENRYLTREVCFVFTVENMDTYILRPATQFELRQLVEALKPAKGLDCDVIVGVRGPTAPPEMCNGLQVPIVLCDRVYSFEVEEFLNAIPQPKNMVKGDFKNAARELFDRIMQLVDNVGEMDEHRAVNYIALRYPAIYSLALEMHALDRSLVRVDVQPSRLSGTRRVVNVIFSYVDRKTDVVDKHFIRVDVTEKFPFLVSKLQPFYDR